MTPVGASSLVTTFRPFTHYRYIRVKKYNIVLMISKDLEIHIVKKNFFPFIVNDPK
jgi:hypothetical protein